ncbi:helix-turn-helix domain-containing protein [Vibrio sonorensis]|uniref:helix-turn-helix domain-containing protein n=1 Tax=Vibrio sonorensis TaxID=1004316 RepID=UPI0008DB16CD|nr:LysR family transcriptional regulator [Vibrio sonorensis]
MEDISFDELALFVRLSKFRSLTEASSKLNIPLATLSRKLKNLEHRLNTRLVERNSHQFVLTKSGKST